jgi:hypothetical protein
MVICAKKRKRKKDNQQEPDKIMKQKKQRSYRLEHPKHSSSNISSTLLTHTSTKRAQGKSDSAKLKYVSASEACASINTTTARLATVGVAKRGANTGSRDDTAWAMVAAVVSFASREDAAYKERQEDT